MRNLFKNIFFSSKTKKVDTTKKIKNYLLFSIDIDGDIFVEYLIKDKSDNSAIFLSNLLYELNGGKYTTELINLLLKLSKDNTQYSDFVKKTIACWSMIITDETKNINLNDDKPIITPSQFYSGDSK